ncbi:MAG TPA: cytochrome c family protein [Rhizomicrobium sp.]|jgi:cytochrome c|nr:cytochrome c family protein [Rhizomicrobium sp.]
MDSFEWNKIIGAVLGSVLFILVVKVAAETIYEPETPAKPGYIVQGVVETPTAGGAAAPAEEAMPDWGTVLPAADVSQGKTISAKCEQCHDTSSAKTIKIGPPLYGVVDRPRASIPGFDYSSAMKGKGGTWTFDELFKFIKLPGAYIPGTKMTFAGLPSAKDRIDLIAFLRTNSASPAPIPPPAPPKPAAAASGPSPSETGKNPGGPTPAPAPATGSNVQSPANIGNGKANTDKTQKAPATPAKNSSTGN